MADDFARVAWLGGGCEGLSVSRMYIAGALLVLLISQLYFSCAILSNYLLILLFI